MGRVRGLDGAAWVWSWAGPPGSGWGCLRGQEGTTRGGTAGRAPGGQPAPRGEARRHQGHRRPTGRGRTGVQEGQKRRSDTLTALPGLEEPPPAHGPHTATHDSGPRATGTAERARGHGTTAQAPRESRTRAAREPHDPSQGRPTTSRRQAELHEPPWTTSSKPTPRPPGLTTTPRPPTEQHPPTPTTRAKTVHKQTPDRRQTAYNLYTNCHQIEDKQNTQHAQT